MSIKITIPNSSSDVLTFGSGNTPTAAQIAGIDSGSSNGQLALYTTASGTSTEAMRITAAQNVGIGTSSPIKKLVVSNSGAAGLELDPFTRSATTGTSLLSYNRSTSAFVRADYDAEQHLFFTSTTERARITSAGELLVGTTADQTGARIQSQLISVSRTTSLIPMISASSGGSNCGLLLTTNSTSSRTAIVFENNSGAATVGSITTNGSATAYVTSSDYRLKENVQPMTGALARVAALKPCTYTWKSTGEVDEGFIAHELQEVCPSAVIGEKDAVNENGSINPQGIDTSFLVATLTAAIQEQQAIITSLTDRITALENK